jgi:hypothetical protein
MIKVVMVKINATEIALRLVEIRTLSFYILCIAKRAAGHLGE